MRRVSWTWLVLAIVAVLVSAATFGANRLFSELSCWVENSVCGESSSSRTNYEGRLFDYRGRPASRTELEFGNPLYGDDFDHAVTTDDQGRFCVRAATYGSDAAVPGQDHVSRRVVRSRAPVDPRFADPEVLEDVRNPPGRVDHPGPNYFGFMVVGPGDLSATGAYTIEGLWDRAVDSASSCQDLGRVPIWHRFEDLEASWQYKVLDNALWVIPVLFLGAVALWVAARDADADDRPATWALRAVAAAGALHVLLFVVLWSAG